jgi:ribosomal protein S16
MIIKYKHKKKKTNINNIVLRLQRRGCNFYAIYNLVILHKKSRAQKGKILDSLGFFNPNFNERFLFFDSIKLYYWLEHGLIIQNKVKNYILKFIIK